MEGSEKSAKKGHTHMKMMAFCCGIPLVLAIGVSVIGINSESLITLILLLCPVIMVGMMFMMNKKGGKSCCDAQEEQTEKPAKLFSGNVTPVKTSKNM